MYYVLVPQAVIESRNVFTDYPKLADGRTILPIGDLRFTNFSYGEVELINQSDLDSLIDSQKSNTKKGGTK